jgi:hypothetical protein
MKMNTSAEAHIAFGFRTEKRPHTRPYLLAASIILILSFDLSARDDYTLLYPPLFITGAHGARHFLDTHCIALLESEAHTNWDPPNWVVLHHWMKDWTG